MSSPFQIPIIDLRAQYSELRDEMRSAIDEVLESQQFILGPAVSRLENLMADYLRCRHTIGVASGSDALLLALMALEIGPGDAVITTPFTFFSTVSSITRLGATPLFVDIESDDLLLSAKGVERFLSDRVKLRNGDAIETKTGTRVKALLPVHLFGQCCAMQELGNLAAKYQLRIIEDVAQACGARLNIDGKIRFAGTAGDIGCFSFFPSKTLGGFGDGGLLSTDADSLNARLCQLRMHGESAKYHHDLTGINSRLDSLQAAVLGVKLKCLDSWCENRIARAETYCRLFTASGLIGHGILALPRSSTEKSHVFNNYVIRVERRDALKQFLAEQSIQSEIYYPVPLHLQKCFANLAYRPGDFPHAEQAANEVLALPLYPELTLNQQETVVSVIQRFFGR